MVSAFCYATGSRNYLAPILIRPRTCSAALSAEEPDTGEVYHNSQKLGFNLPLLPSIVTKPLGRGSAELLPVVPLFGQNSNSLNGF